MSAALEERVWFVGSLGMEGSVIGMMIVLQYKASLSLDVGKAFLCCGRKCNQHEDTTSTQRIIIVGRRRGLFDKA